jgi:hypothetical protein
VIARTEARAWAKVVAAALLCEALSYALDRVTVGASTVAVGAWAAGAAVMLALRLALVFVVPGWMVARVAIAWIERRRS